MLVAVVLRRTDPRAAVHPLTGEVHRDPYADAASEADRCALEHALRIAESFACRCLAVTVGPAAAEDVLREALAAGADEALRIEGADDAGAAGAHTLHAGLVAGGGPLPDVVLCGDDGTGALPAYLAHRTGAAQALGLSELLPGKGELAAVRRLGGGRVEDLAVPLPAVCSVDPAGVRLRRAPLPAVLAARTAVIRVVRVADAPAPAVTAGRPRPYRPRPRVLPAPRGEAPRQRLRALTGADAPPRTPPRVVVPDTPADAARVLLDYLRERSYLP